MTSRERNIIVGLAVLVVFVVILAVLRFTVLQPATPEQAQALVPTAVPTDLPEATEMVPVIQPTVEESLRPNDPRFDQQWYLPAIGAPQAWPNLPADQAPVIVAVVDSGICANHPDLVGRIVQGIDLINEPNPRDLVGDDFVIDRPLPGDIPVLDDAMNHGCAMANIIAANTNNAIGIAGIAPNAMIMPVKVLDWTGNGTVEGAAAGIRYAVDNGASIVNLSLVLNPGSTDAEIAAITDAVNYATERGVTLVASAGNTYGGPARMPASFEPVISVGALNQSMQPSEISAGTGVDVWAPGEAILSASIFSQGGQPSFDEFEGASIAAAIVSGVLAATGSVPTQTINGLPVLYMNQ